MKLRFRDNSLRLRLNRREVEGLASGAALEERVLFPESSRISYILESSRDPYPGASFYDGVIRISAPEAFIKPWAAADTIGIYFELPTDGAALKIAIEKDLECIEAPMDERDPDAFPRAGKGC
jgi:hypothetical protein